MIASIDTGAGEISFNDNPITIGMIVKDREGVICDDSCEFACDGVCDDVALSPTSSAPLHYNSYDDYYQAGTADYQVGRACVRGTDCTDCGGVDAVIDYSNPPSCSYNRQSDYCYLYKDLCLSS